MERVGRGIGGARYIKLRVLQVSKSNSHDVTLVNVSRELTGMYKCEVSAGSPSYHTLIERAKMEVVGKYVRALKRYISFFFEPFASAKDKSLVPGLSEMYARLDTRFRTHVAIRFVSII